MGTLREAPACTYEWGDERVELCGALTQAVTARDQAGEITGVCAQRPGRAEDLIS